MQRILSTARTVILFVLGLIILGAAAIGFIWFGLWSFIIILGAVVIGLFFFIFRGQGEGKNRDIINITIMFSGFVGLFAFVAAFGKPIPISQEGFWLCIELGLIAFLLALALLFVEGDYEGLERMRKEYDSLTDYLKKERIDEKNSLIRVMSVSDLLALKDKHKSEKQVVKIIEDILEERE